MKNIFGWNTAGWSLRALEPRRPQQTARKSARASKINICSSRKILPRAETRTGATGLSPGEKLPQEKKMRTLAMILGAAAVIAVAAPVAADPATGRLQLAQAQDSGSQSGASTGARQQGSSGMSQQGSGGQREGGSATTRQSSGGGAAVNQTQRSSSRTSVRERSEGVAVRGGSRTTVGVRSGASDDVIVHRKKARRYVYSEPSTTVVKKKKRFVRYHEEPSSVVIHKRRAGVAVDSGVSTRTSVRSRTSTAVSGSSTKRTGATVRERSSGQGNAGAASSTEGRAPSGARSGGANAGRSAPSGGDKGQSPSGQQ
jgi:hypothetical protein